MNDLVKKDPVTEIIQGAMPKFNQIAERHKLVQWATESQFAIQSLQKNQRLAQCVPYTIQNAVINVAAVGLTLNPADGYAYLVPEYNKDTKQNECQLRVSFKGLIKIANDSGAISWVKAEVVKENDTFEYRGISEPPEHKMNPFDERGDTVGVYCVAKTTSGEYLVDIMTRAEIKQIRECAKTDVVWEQWPDEMAKKAIIKRAAKQWPKSDKTGPLHAAIDVINEYEGGDPAYLLYTPEQKETFDALIESGDAYEFFLFIKSLERDVNIALHNSGEKGKKTALKDAARQLEAQGYEVFESMVDNAKVYIESGDYVGLTEIMDDAGSGKKLIWGSLSPEEQAKALEMKEENERSAA